MASKPPTRPLQKADAAHGKYVVSAGKGFMPFLKQCSTYFLKRLGHFLWKGMKPFPALGKCDTYLGSTLKKLSLIRKYGVHDEAYLGRLNNRFAIHAASYLCKGYYRDTKLPFRVRQQRWSTIAHDSWFRNMKLSDVESDGRKMIMFVCRWHLHWLLDPLLCILLKNH